MRKGVVPCCYRVNTVALPLEGAGEKPESVTQAAECRRGEKEGERTDAGSFYLLSDGRRHAPHFARRAS